MRRRGFLFILALIGIFLINESFVYSAELTLKIWDVAAPLRDPYRKIIFEKFEKENPGVKIEYEGIPWGQYMEKIITSIAAGMSPDVIRFGYAPRFASKGMLTPLDDYIKGRDGIKLDVYAKGALNAAHMWKGKIYALPHDLVPYGVFYNMDILEKAGATIPKSLEEFNVLAKKLTKKDAKGEFIQRGLQVSEYPDYILMWLYNRGARDVDKYDHDVKSFILNSPEGVQGLTDIVELYKAGVAISAQNEQAFVTGYTAMWATQANDAYMFRPEVYPKFRFGFSLLPPPRGKKAVLTGVCRDGTFIPINAKNKDWAWKLAKAYSSKEATALLYQGKYGTLPPFKDILQKPPATSAYEFYQKDPFLVTLAQVALRGLISPVPHWDIDGEEIGTIMGEEFGNALRSVKTPKQALDDMARRVNEIFQRR